jgi:hypothetical protein
MASPPEINGARFGCGFLLGVVIALLTSLPAVFSLDSKVLVYVLVVAVVFGIAALRYGDAFWRTIGNWLRF